MPELTQFLTAQLYESLEIEATMPNWIRIKLPWYTKPISELHQAHLVSNINKDGTSFKEEAFGVGAEKMGEMLGAFVGQTFGGGMGRFSFVY